MYKIVQGSILAAATHVFNSIMKIIFDSVHFQVRPFQVASILEGCPAAVAGKHPEVRFGLTWDHCVKKEKACTASQTTPRYQGCFQFYSYNNMVISIDLSFLSSLCPV